MGLEDENLLREKIETHQATVYNSLLNLGLAVDPGHRSYRVFKDDPLTVRYDFGVAIKLPDRNLSEGFEAISDEALAALGDPFIQGTTNGAIEFETLIKRRIRIMEGVRLYLDILRINNMMRPDKINAVYTPTIGNEPAKLDLDKLFNHIAYIYNKLNAAGQKYPFAFSLQDFKEIFEYAIVREGLKNILDRLEMGECVIPISVIFQENETADEAISHYNNCFNYQAHELFGTCAIYDEQALKNGIFMSIGETPLHALIVQNGMMQSVNNHLDFLLNQMGVKDSGIVRLMAALAAIYKAGLSHGGRLQDSIYVHRPLNNDNPATMLFQILNLKSVVELKKGMLGNNDEYLDTVLNDMKCIEEALMHIQRSNRLVLREDKLNAKKAINWFCEEIMSTMQKSSKGPKLKAIQIELAGMFANFYPDVTA